MNFLKIAGLALTGLLNNVSFVEAGANACTSQCQANFDLGLKVAVTPSDDNIILSVGDFQPFLSFKRYGNERMLSDNDLYSCDKQDYALMFVGAGQHLALAAISECVGTEEVCKCPSALVFHQATMVEEDSINGVKKEIIEVSEDELAQHDSLSVGTFPLGKIVASFDEAKSEKTVYDFVTHNCGTLLIEMALELGIDPTDKSVATYAANHLSKYASSSTIKKLSENDFRSATENNSNLNDEQYTMIEGFVQNYIEERV
jgi:hypothetical protein